MEIKLEKLPKGHVAFTVTVSVEEMKPHLDRAAKKISEEIKFEGFRAGHVPYDMVKARVGEMKIYEAAAEEAVRDTYPKAVVSEKIATIGSPAIDVLSLAPGNPFSYRATASVLPEVTLGDYAGIIIEAKKPTVTEDDINKTLKELQGSRRQETVVDRVATKEDKVVVDLEMFLDRVPLDGGQTKNHSIFLAETYYIPGLAEQLIGMKKGETKEFELVFPKENFQKHIAGKLVKFRVKMSDVYALAVPAIDDAFAITFGQKTLEELKAILRNNLQEERNQKEGDRQEIELLKALVKRSKFGDIPDLLMTNETTRMIDELEQTIARQGGEFEKYLESIKKTRAQLALDFAPEALERVKTALVVRNVTDKEKIAVTPEELLEETKKMERLYPNDSEMQSRIRSGDGQEYLRSTMRNRKTVAFLRSKATMKGN
ncbi:MAG: trigger factor [bacterium]|nr:trigger factor [bacterium]